MATRINRAATASSKKGGRNTKRNKLTSSYNDQKSIDHEINQKAFRMNRHETLARRHNATTTEPTDQLAAGVPEGRDFTPKRRAPEKIWRGRPSLVFTLQSL